MKLQKVGTEGHAPGFQLQKGVEGRVGSSGIRLERGTRRSSLNLHPKTNHGRLVQHSGHPLVLGLTTGTWTHKTHHGPNSGVNHHLTPYSFLCDWPWRLHPNGTNSRDSRNGVPNLSRRDSQNFELPYLPTAELDRNEV